ncbi:MAG: hypothetical protein ACW98Y_03735 [Candidatus Thorarchaeota archaeon]
MLEGEEKEGTRLTRAQLISVAEQLNQGDSLHSYVQTIADDFNPLSVAVFVFNDAVWKLMEKKEVSTDTMLPMVTIPGFFWKQSSVSQGNPYGSERDSYHKSSCVYNPGKNISIMGSGGDFCGIVEAQLAEHKTRPRPVLAPHLPGPTNPVPRYESDDIGINISLTNISVELYTNPQKRMDYTFSEHPKVFYDHGMALVTDGSNVQLRVGGKKPQNLYGDVWVLFGKRWGPEEDPLKVIQFHVWLNALNACIQQ